MQICLTNSFLMKYTFKTNIKCGGCIAKVQPVLDAETAISSWEVDTNDPEKILTVETASLDAHGIVELVESAGFQATEKKKGLLNKLFG